MTSFSLRLPLAAHPSLFVSALLLASVTLLPGCDLFGSDETSDAPSLSDTQIAVGNGGNFSAQDGSLTIYSPAEDTSFRDDIDVAFLHLIKVIDDRLYVVENTLADNAGRITAFEADDRTRIGQIQNVRPPRDIAVVSDEKAYVTNLTLDENFQPVASTVSIVNPGTFAFIDTLAVGRNPEGIEVVNGRAFVANSADRTVSVIDTGTDTIEESVDLCTGPNAIFVDGDGELAIVCQGSTPEVVFMNPETLAVNDRVALDGSVSSANGTQAAYYSAGAEKLFIINGSAFDQTADSYYEVDTATNTFTGETELPASDRFIGITAVAYDNVAQELYLTRLPVNANGGADYNSAGAAFVLDRDGVPVDTFEVGAASSHIEVIRDAE